MLLRRRHRGHFIKALFAGDWYAWIFLGLALASFACIPLINWYFTRRQRKRRGRDEHDSYVSD